MKVFLTGLCFQCVYMITMGEFGHSGWEVVVGGFLVAYGFIGLGSIIEGKGKR